MLLYILIFTITISSGLGCDDAKWSIAEKAYDSCVAESSLELERLAKLQDGPMSLESCRQMDQLLECSALLTDCMATHFAESEQKLFSLPVDPSATNSVLECQQLLMQDEDIKHNINKRSPGRGGGGGFGGGRGGGGGSIGSGGGKGGSTGGSRVGQVASALGVGRKGTASGLAGGVKKGGTLKKIGKYAVAGLAVYGTYKLAKSLGKGLRELYDDDDCWSYDLYNDRYTCVCGQQCNIYASGSVPVASVSVVALLASVLIHAVRF